MLTDSVERCNYFVAEITVELKKLNVIETSFINFFMAGCFFILIILVYMLKNLLGDTLQGMLESEMDYELSYYDLI